MSRCKAQSHTISHGNTRASQLHLQKSLTHGPEQIKRDMKSSPICGALIRWREGGCINSGGRAPPAGQNICNYTPVKPSKPAPTLPLTRPLTKTPPELALVHHTLYKPPAELHNSGFFSKCVKSLIIICLNCINNPHSFNRIFL